MDAEIFIFIGAVIEIIIIIFYFILCSNVSKLKEKACSANVNFRFKFNLLLTIGQKEEAKKLLLEAMLNDKTYGFTEQERIRYLIVNYTDALDKLGIKVDTEFFESLGQK